MASLLDEQRVPVFNIPVEQIAVIDRVRKNMGDVAELAERIKAEGQHQAGIVRPAVLDDQAEGIDPLATPWVLVAGGRRYAACCLAGLDTFKAELKGDLPPLEQKIIELGENLGRKDLDWDEEDRIRKEIHDLRTQIAAAKGEKWTLADTGRELGETAMNISRAVRVAEEIEKDPSLRQAGSRKAAVRMIEFREHLARQEAKIGKGPAASLRSAMVTADARDWLQRQGTGTADLLLTDMPYGYDYHSNARKDSPETYSTEYDDSEGVTLDLFVSVVPEFIRVTKESGWICLFMAESNVPYLRDLMETCCTTHYEYGEVIWEQQENGDWIKHMPAVCDVGANVKDAAPCSFLRAEVPSWIWFRPNSRNPGRLPERHAKNFYEPILVFNRGSGRLYKHQDECPNVLVYDAEYGNERIHANQKPRAIARELVQRFTMPGEVVVDPFFGSGNLLAGAAELNRRIYGCDKGPLMLGPALANVSNYYGG
jgi:ParB-like chromosome segregation protein Spo0J/DNA modification methylase